jgi:transcription-repair coupling factor (superfamily II helicase)
MARKARRNIKTLPDLVPSLHQTEGFADTLTDLARGKSTAIDGAWGSSCALTAAVLATAAKSTLLVVLPRISDVDDFADDLASFLGEAPLLFPAWESLPQEHNIADAIFGTRLRVLSALSGPSPPGVVVTSLPALIQPVPSRAQRRRDARTFRTGDEADPDKLMRWLVDRGFERVPAIEVPGEFSMHGGILDLFPADAENPLRIELFGDVIESIRTFDVETQRKVEELSEARLAIVAPVESLPSGDSDETAASTGEQFVESLPSGSWIVLSELEQLIQEGKDYRARLEDRGGLYSVESTMARVADFPLVTLAAIGADSSETTQHLQVESIERFTGPRGEVLNELASTAARDEQVLIACHNEGERGRLAEMLDEAELPIAERIQLCIGHVSRGFRLVSERIVVVSDDELFGRSELHRVPAKKRRLETRAIDSFLELREGDLVVHLTNGIGRYRGMELLEKDDQVEEHLVLEFRDAVRVYVPVSLIHLVQKYVGAARAAPNLSKLGTTSWSKKKQRAAAAVVDLASDMIRLQAARQAKPGIAFPRDSHWQHEFDASFPYVETEDQLLAISEVKADMEQPRPMDRLICGDVGYGKTEVAMRAAFKAVEAGKQVAVLVPTTVLAEQHFRTFRERMAEYPISIEVLSRFRTKSEQRKILALMEESKVDLVIGTHRLVQRDVRFKELGLLIIDEEQRFGVEAKEMLKQLRLEVDVLTMSATPIPRTLHMSLLGVRDISNLQTAPQERQAIETRICRFDNELVRNAVIRELNRNGQLFFVHNRVYNIQSIADRLQSIVPEACIGIGHGQMREHELEEVMFDFVSGKIDILVCTTIIESGLDIPNANTIFIHQADQFGLADLHQLRGRVGRYKHRAYCYLMPAEGRSLTQTGAKRLKAVEEFSELGAGFKIAMRDLEIRGAGNILGTEQSGHISAVGYELYCRLLENAARTLRNEPLREEIHVATDLPISAFLPDSYVPLGRHKMEVYRKLSSVQISEELADLESEIRDRFGPFPAEVGRLFQLRELQLAAASWKIDDIHLEDRFIVLGYRHPEKMRGLANLHNSRLRIVDKRTAYWPREANNGQPDDLLRELRSVLQPS